MHRKPRNATQKEDVKKQVHGEGNYQATRDYNAGVKEHLATHDVEQEARDAAPGSSVEREEMESAERAGRARSRGEDSKKKPLPE